MVNSDKQPTTYGGRNSFDLLVQELLTQPPDSLLICECGKVYPTYGYICQSMGWGSCGFCGERPELRSLHN